jgi:type II secretory pathway pseudopilin PulG
MPRRRPAAVSVVIAVALVAGAYASGGTEARSGTASTKVRTVASTTTTDFRAVVEAARRGAGAAPEATLTLTTFERHRGAWQRTGTHRLAGTYFWKTVTGPRAVCRFEITTAGAQAKFRPRAVVQFLLSPSLACGPVSEHVLDG